MNRIKRYILPMLLLGSTFLYGFTSSANAEYGPADNEGFQRPKEKINHPKNNAQSLEESLDGFKRQNEEEKTFLIESAKERQKAKDAKDASDALFFENIDGFRRPKKSE